MKCILSPYISPFRSPHCFRIEKSLEQITFYTLNLIHFTYKNRDLVFIFIIFEKLSLIAASSVKRDGNEIISTVNCETLHCLLQEWKTCQIILGKTGKESIMRHISNFDPKDCYLDVALSSKMLLEPYSLEQIRDVSAGAATFFVWVSKMSFNKNKSTNTIV